MDELLVGFLITCSLGGLVGYGVRLLVVIGSVGFVVSFIEVFCVLFGGLFAGWLGLIWTWCTVVVHMVYTDVVFSMVLWVVG